MDLSSTQIVRLKFGAHETLHRPAINILATARRCIQVPRMDHGKAARRFLLQLFKFLAVKRFRVISKDDFLSQAILCQDHKESIMG